MNRSEILNIHKELGGFYSVENKTYTPDYYTDVNKEPEHVRSNAGIIDLTGRGKLKISGRDHLKLLQGMTTNDVIKLGYEKGNHAAALTAKGRMVADFNTFKFRDFVILDLEPGLNKNLIEHLIKFRLSYKADIEDLTHNFSHFHVCGPNSNHILEKFSKIPVARMTEYDIRTIKNENTDIYLVKLNRTGETGFDLILDIENGGIVLTEILNISGDMHIKPFGKIAFNTLRIEAGKPAFGIDMNEDTIPIEAGLWNALDFEKGCYIGQEVIARIKWRGRVNWHLVGFISSENKDILVGSKIINDNKEIGRITSSTFSGILDKHIALGYIRREFNEENQQVLISIGENSHLKATVCELPFINNFN